ncbi:hypothetical protein [Bacteroides sp. GM023]|uniref:hypothetical protein n=1 Tax=Bacteroides sp. GM023 TaxID=2723058 RepID=UPI001CC2C7E3|nr:hypothetical protein [Bacteroides sp. GM023]
MAILSNGKFYGFLCSVKETGQKLANGVKEYVEDFVSGFSGYGWKLWEYVTGKWKLEIDTIVVRETMLVFEMLISKVRAIIGAQAITQGHGKVKSARISDDGTEYLIVLEDEDMSIVTHDFVRCQTFTSGRTKLYHVEVFSVDVETKTLHIPLSEFEQDELGNVLYPPVSGDELVQFGNSQNKVRQSAIYMHADETGQPAIDVMFDIDSKNWDGKVKVRVGGDIPDSGGLKGFYCENGMIKGADSNGHTVYCIYPDGTAEFGDGSAMFCTDKSGHIAGGAISWIWNAEKKKCICTMKDVVLTWDNLSDEAKENLKGEPGTDGKDGMRVYITYNDNEEEPVKPMGDGTTEGWHTNLTASVIWISQKVAESPSTGEWGTPIRFKGKDGKPGQDTNLLPWIEKWNGYATELGEDYIVTPKMFSGTRSADGKLTGIVQGKDCLTDNKTGEVRTGIFALVDNKIVFELDPVSKKYRFTGDLNLFADDDHKILEITSENLGGNRVIRPMFTMKSYSPNYQKYNMILLNGDTLDMVSDILGSRSASISPGYVSISDRGENESIINQLKISTSGGASLSSTEWKTPNSLLGVGETYVDENGFLRVKM